jgi:NAD(P)-dependent dehydrogenase (short-subunit alcohol dehydrogenase family)
MRLKGKTAVVTGGGTGIGQAVAWALAAEGCAVVISGRRKEPLEQTIAEAPAGSKMLAHAADVGNREEAERLIEWSLEQLGGIDILINNAGVNVPKRALAELSIEDWELMMRVNASGTFYCTRTALPGMRERGDAVIVNVVSIAGIRASKLGGIGYSASKFAMHALGISTALEEGKHGIRVTNVYPGEVDTPILLNRPVPVSEEHRARILQGSDVADAIVMVCCLHPRAHVPELVICPTSYDYC